MGSWHFGTCGEETDRPLSGQNNDWIKLLLFVVVLLVLVKSGMWWLMFAFWWMIPGFGGRNSGCATDAEKTKRDAMYEKPKREPVYIYDESGAPLEVIDAPEKPKRHAGDTYDYF
ncbi:MAG: hypothetical protein KJ065_28295 [Anaerolineae bacterium]|nr:hypothetical protein [Anaerolineae bacterium]